MKTFNCDRYYFLKVVTISFIMVERNISGQQRTHWEITMYLLKAPQNS